jgi:hypothetical protein
MAMAMAMRDGRVIVELVCARRFRRVGRSPAEEADNRENSIWHAEKLKVVCSIDA